MRIPAIQLADVKGEAGVVGHRHEELLHELGVVATNLLGWDRQPIAEVEAAEAVERHLHQGRIQRRHEVTEVVDAAPLAVLPQQVGQ